MAEDGTGTGIDDAGSDQATATAAAGDPQVSSSESTGRASDDYMQRLETDHTFAVEQAQNWQKKFSRKNSEYDKVKDLTALQTYADQVGGAETLKAHLDLYDRVLQDPAGKAAIESFARTGQLTTATREDNEEDEWMDPEQKRLDALEHDNATMRSRLASLDMGQIEGRMKGSFDSVFKEFPGLQGELLEKVNKGCMGDIKQFGTTESGRDSLRTMNEAGARAMMLRHLTPDELREVFSNERQLHTEEKQGFATHEASSVSSTGGGGELAEAGMAAYLSACREHGVDPEANPSTWGK